MKGTGLFCCQPGQVRKKAAVTIKMRSVSLRLVSEEDDRRKPK